MPVLQSNVQAIALNLAPNENQPSFYYYLKNYLAFSVKTYVFYHKS
jgi:hypothetical protein